MNTPVRYRARVAAFAGGRMAVPSETRTALTIAGTDPTRSTMDQTMPATAKTIAAHGPAVAQS
jgi:hypothetical protein